MSLRIALLGLLKGKGPASGYDLAKLFEHSLAHVWQAGHTQIYPELVKMAGDGLVTVEHEGARGRKIYRIAPEGERLLHDWLLQYEPNLTIRSQTALQTFLMPLLDREEAIFVVERIRELFLRRREELDREASTGFGTYALKLGRAQVSATVAWAEEVLADLRRD